MDRGVACVSSLHYQTDVPIAGSEPSPQTVLDKLDEHFSTSGKNMGLWRALLNNGAKLVETRLYEEVDPLSDDAPAGVLNPYDLAGTSGSLGSDVLPVELCVYISLTTAKLGRSYRGGVHTPPMSDPADLSNTGLVDTGRPIYTAYGALGTAIVDVLDDVFSTTGDIKPIIYSRTRRSRGLSFSEDITAARVNTKARWLRRRATAP